MPRNFPEINDRIACFCRVLLVWTVWLMTPAAVRGLWADEGTSLPSWRQGVSRWNGKGYDSPPGPSTPATTPSPARTATPRPYTVPTDPFAHTHGAASRQWGDLPTDYETAAVPVSPGERAAEGISLPTTAIPEGLAEGGSSAGSLDNRASGVTLPASTPRFDSPPVTTAAAKRPASLDDDLQKLVNDPSPDPPPKVRWYQYPSKWGRDLAARMRLGRKR